MRFRYPGILALWLAVASSAVGADPPRPFDVVVFGATPSGICAAIAASREGATVALVEPMDLVGGIMSSGLSFSDSNQTARECLRGLFEEIHLRIEKDYVDRGITLPYHVREKDQKPWTYEPHVAERVFNAMLRESKVTVLLEHGLQSLDKQGTRIVKLTTTRGLGIRGRVFVDASYEGDLMALAGVRYRVGREGRAEYGESLAGKQFPKREVSASPFADSGALLPLMTGREAGDVESGDANIMTYSFRLCLSTDPGNRVPITRPADYDPSRYELYRRMFAASPGLPFPVDLYPIPGGKLDGNNGIGKQFSIGLVGASREWPDASPERRREIWNDHKSYTLGLLWFLANDPGVPEPFRNQAGELGLAKDEFAKYGHWPPVLYVREARRMVGEYVLTQSDIRENITKPDPIAVASFPIDSHDCQRVPGPNGGVLNEGTIFPERFKTGRAIGQPHQLPYRAVLPKAGECDNLLVPVCLSASHVALCSVRVEPTWMVLGQSCGIAAAMIARQDIPAQKLPYHRLRPRLLAAGQHLELPADAR